MAQKVSDVVNRLNTVINGEFEVVDTESDDWRTYLEAINHNITLLFNLPHTRWNILYDMNYYADGAVSKDNSEYSLPDFTDYILGNSIKDNIYFVKDNKVVSSRKLVRQDEYDSSQKAATIVNDTLYVKGVSDNEVGCSIRIPVYGSIPQYRKPKDVMPDILAPYLIEASAGMLCAASPVSFIARNAERHEKRAEELYKALVEVNDVSQKSDIQPVEAAIMSGSSTDSIMELFNQSR